MIALVPYLLEHRFSLGAEVAFGLGSTGAVCLYKRFYHFVVRGRLCLHCSQERDQNSKHNAQHGVSQSLMLEKLYCVSVDGTQSITQFKHQVSKCYSSVVLCKATSWPLIVVAT